MKQMRAVGTTPLPAYGGTDAQSSLGGSRNRICGGTFWPVIVLVLVVILVLELPGLPISSPDEEERGGKGK